MFTLKLFRRVPGCGGAAILQTKIIAVDHVRSQDIAEHTVQIMAFNSRAETDFSDYYVGERTEAMTAATDENSWGWALLENWEGKTTHHFRPHNYG